MTIRTRHARSSSDSPSSGLAASGLARTCAVLALLAAAGRAARAGSPPSSCGPITISPAALARPALGLHYAADLVGGGGIAPYTFAVTAGALPYGLALTPDGALRGAALAPGAYAFTVTATDGDGCVGSASWLVPVAKGFRAADDQVGLSIPPAGTGGSGDPALDAVSSTVQVAGITGAVAVVGLEVHVTLLHERAGDLELALVAPDSTRMRLSERRGGLGADFLGTVFSDGAPDDVCDGSAPFAASYRPEDPLVTTQSNGTWTLEVTDAAAGSTGVLLDWSLQVETATAGMTLNHGLERWLWLRDFGAPLGGTALDDTRVYVAAGDSVIGASRNWPYTVDWLRVLPSGEPREPTWLNRSSLSPLLVVLNRGWLYGLDPADGQTLWARDLRRPTCASDGLSTTAFQLAGASDCDFRAAVPGDLVFAGTDHACTGTNANRVYAVDPSTGNVRWTFNATGSLQMGVVTGLVADVSRNLVFATSDKDPTRVQSTVWALDSRNGAKRWSIDEGQVLVPPVVADGLFVLARDGELSKHDPDSGATLWSLTLAGGTRVFEHPLAYDPTRGLVFAVDSTGELHAIEDQVSAAATLWTQATLPWLRRVVVTPARALLYASAVGGRVYEIDELTGVVGRSTQTGACSSAPELEVGATAGGAFAESRLLASCGTRLDMIRLPWFPQDILQQATDYPRPVRVEWALEGATSPPAVLAGEPVTDTLEFTNRYNRAPALAVVRAPLPPRTRLVSASVPGGTAALEGDELVLRLGRVEIGEAVAIEVTLVPEAAGAFTRTYTVSSELPTPRSVTLENQVTRARRRHP